MAYWIGSVLKERKMTTTKINLNYNKLKNYIRYIESTMVAHSNSSRNTITVGSSCSSSSSRLIQQLVIPIYFHSYSSVVVVFILRCAKTATATVTNTLVSCCCCCCCNNGDGGGGAARWRRRNYPCGFNCGFVFLFYKKIINY